MPISSSYLKNPGYNKALLDSVKADLPSFAVVNWIVGAREVELTNIQDLVVGFQDAIVDQLGTSLLVYGATKASLYTIRSRESYGWATATKISSVTIVPIISSMSLMPNGKNILLGCTNSSYPRYLIKNTPEEMWYPDKTIDITTYATSVSTVLCGNDNLSYLLGSAGSIYKVVRTSTDVEWTTTTRTVLTNGVAHTCLGMGVDYLDFFAGSASYIYVFTRATNVADWVAATRLTIPGSDTIGSWSKLMVCKNGTQMIGIRSVSDSPYLITKLPGTAWSAATTTIVKMSSITARTYSAIVPINDRQFLLMTTGGRTYLQTITTLTHPTLMGTI